jgi:serine/threonine protein kinase
LIVDEQASAAFARRRFVTYCCKIDPRFTRWGWRLPGEGDVAGYIDSRLPAYRPEPTPSYNTDVFRLSRSASASEIALPEIQPSDIEEIPGYELLGVLGRGGMGIVFRARQISLKRQVALKMILTGRHARPSDRLRFQKEAESVARLQHPNIVQIYEVGQQNGLPYFSLEFVNAGSLAQFLGGSPQPSRVSAQLLLHLADAMHYAHKRGIVHRDLKPANILLHLDESRIMRDGQSADTAVFQELLSYVPKISDFGLAKNLDGEEQLRHGTLVGTPSYMAPEQAGGTGAVGPPADVYALGAILYEMLTGRPPFKGTTLQETAQQVLTQDAVLPTQLQPNLPTDLETICLTCLQKNPDYRYSSAEALGEDLRRFLDNQPILALSAPLPDRVLTWARHRPRAALAITLGMLLVGSLFHAWGDLTRTLRDERNQARADYEQTSARLQGALLTIDRLTAGADACRRLGELHRQHGDTPAAIAAYREAIELYTHLNGEFPEQADYARRLEECRQQLRGVQVAAP